MKTEYESNYTISYTEVNQELELGLTNTIGIVQSIATDYFTSFGSDNKTVKDKSNALWVLSKTKVHFNKLPKWRDFVLGKSYTTKVKPIRVEMETIFKDEKDEILFGARQEVCAIDLETRKIRKIDTIHYPKDMEIRKAVDQESYSKLNEIFTEKDFVYEQKIYSTDIDYSKHKNNASYVRFISNLLSCDFLDKNQITDFEIHYLSETIEGQILKIYKKERTQEMEFLIKENNREIIRAILKYKLKNS